MPTGGYGEEKTIRNGIDVFHSNNLVSGSLCSGT